MNAIAQKWEHSYLNYMKKTMDKTMCYCESNSTNFTEKATIRFIFKRDLQPKKLRTTDLVGYETRCIFSPALILAHN